MPSMNVKKIRRLHVLLFFFLQGEGNWLESPFLTAATSVADIRKKKNAEKEKYEMGREKIFGMEEERATNN